MSDITLLLVLFIHATGVTTCILLLHKWIRPRADGLAEVLFAHFLNLIVALLFSWVWAGTMIYFAKTE